jgi:hypothetical protein
VNLKVGLGTLACVEGLQEVSPIPKFVYFSFSLMVFSSFSSSYESFSFSSSFNK